MVAARHGWHNGPTRNPHMVDDMDTPNNTHSANDVQQLVATGHLATVLPGDSTVLLQLMQTAASDRTLP